MIHSDCHFIFTSFYSKQRDSHDSIKPARFLIIRQVPVTTRNLSNMHWPIRMKQGDCTAPISKLLLPSPVWTKLISVNGCIICHDTTSVEVIICRRKIPSLFSWLRLIQGSTISFPTSASQFLRIKGYAPSLSLSN
jgi:hypothetical protein